MAEWSSYRLEDLLLFSPQTYYRLFELYHRDIWPIQILAPILGIAILVSMIRNPPGRARAVAFALAAAWLWVAWAYHLQHYATINWLADYFALGFALQALLLIGTGVFRSKGVFSQDVPVMRRAGLGMFAFALLIMPFVGWLLGRSWRQLELFAITPDATVVGTLGLLLLTAGKGFWLLYPIPLCWSLVTGATYWAMGSADALLLPLIASVVLILALYRKIITTGG